MRPATQDLQLNIVRYTAEQKTVWDSFVATSKNGTFLFMRDYMDYHADRFADHSLMFYKGGRLIALLPGNESDDCLLYTSQSPRYLLESRRGS